MKRDEFAFVNRQLAEMLRSGIPLEGALRELCRTMARGELKAELQQLENDLSQGVLLDEALSRRKLPPFYTAMLKIGVESNNLPAMLTLLADYYSKVDLIWTRLKGLMVYPGLVLCASLVFTLFVALSLTAFHHSLQNGFLPPAGSGPSVIGPMMMLWVPVVVVALLGLLISLIVFRPRWRRKLRWRLPAFHEAALAQIASALVLMLQSGVHLNRALELLRRLEAGTPAEPELQHWQARLAEGHKHFPQLATGSKIIPPMFSWLVAGSGEDWLSGFRYAAEIYYARAMHKIDMLLYLALPVAVLMLGCLLLGQVVPMFRYFLGMLNWIGDIGS